MSARARQYDSLLRRSVEEEVLVLLPSRTASLSESCAALPKPYSGTTRLVSTWCWRPVLASLGSGSNVLMLRAHNSVSEDAREAYLAAELAHQAENTDSTRDAVGLERRGVES